MARPRKPGSTRSTRAKAGARLKSTSTESDAVEDAEVVEETANAPEEPAASASDEADQTAKKDAKASGDEAKIDTAEDAGERSPDAAASGEAPADETPETALPDTPADEKSEASADTPADEATELGTGAASSTETVVTEAAETSSGDLPRPVAAAYAPPERRGGFFPLFLGGIVAAAIGAGALYLADRQGWVRLGDDRTAPLGERIDAQSAEIAGLMDELAELRAAEPDLSAVTSLIDGLTEVVDGVSQSTIALGQRLDEMEARIDEVATEPIPEARLPEKITAAYEAKLAELEAALEERNMSLVTEQERSLAAIEARVDERLSEMEQVQGDAAAAERAAADAALAAQRRAALAEIDMALDTGASFGGELTELEGTGTEVPEVLSGAADGSISTLAELQAEFPEAARAALVASTRAGAQDGSVDGLTAFFRTQLGARSLEPREGGDPDAVLSRAEATVSRGELQAALDEIAALPEAGQAALSEWTARAQARIEATSALDALLSDLNSN